VKIKHIVALALLTTVVIWMALPREQGALEDIYALPVDKQSVNAVSNTTIINNDSQSFTVRAARIEAQNFVQRIRVRGQTKAFRHVEVRAEEAGRVVATPFPRGSRVNAGDVLCEIAVDSRAADLQEARSRQQQAQMEYDGALDLQSRGLQSRVGLAQLKTALDAASAGVIHAELALQKTRITAPFAGIMETRSVEIGDLMDMGGRCASLLDDTPMLLTGLVPEQDVGKLFLGAPVEATLLTGETLRGSVSYLSRAADSSARSYTIEVTLDASDKPIRQGITAEIYIAASETTAHLVPASAMTLNDEGLVGLKIIDQNNIVQFVAITVIGENTRVETGLWVSGLPASAVVITHGQEIVFPGEAVNPDFTWSSL
jgi:multidrug efflux system membrane fusion protein